MSKKSRNIRIDSEKNLIQELCESYGLPDYVANRYNKSKIIILCEGSKNSFDYRIYSNVYSNAIILPVNSNTEVINKTKGLRKKTNIFYGIVDGDDLTLDEKKTLQDDGVYCLDVYAIENLLAIDEVILMILQYLHVENYVDILNKIKIAAFNLVHQNDRQFSYDNILLQIDPKKVIGLIINEIGSKDSGWKYKDTFFYLLEQSAKKDVLLSYIKTYTPVIE